MISESKMGLKANEFLSTIVNSISESKIDLKSKFSFGNQNLNFLGEIKISPQLFHHFDSEPHMQMESKFHFSNHFHSLNPDSV